MCVTKIFFNRVHVYLCSSAKEMQISHENDFRGADLVRREDKFSKTFEPHVQDSTSFDNNFLKFSLWRHIGRSVCVC